MLFCVAVALAELIVLVLLRHTSACIPHYQGVDCTEPAVWTQLNRSSDIYYEGHECTLPSRCMIARAGRYHWRSDQQAFINNR